MLEVPPRLGIGVTRTTFLNVCEEFTAKIKPPDECRTVAGDSNALPNSLRLHPQTLHESCLNSDSLILSSEALN